MARGRFAGMSSWVWWWHLSFKRCCLPTTARWTTWDVTTRTSAVASKSRDKMASVTLLVSHATSVDTFLMFDHAKAATLPVATQMQSNQRVLQYNRWPCFHEQIPAVSAADDQARSCRTTLHLPLLNILLALSRNLPGELGSNTASQRSSNLRADLRERYRRQARDNHDI